MEEAYRKRKTYEPPLFKRSLSSQLFSQVATKKSRHSNMVILEVQPLSFIGWFAHHHFLAVRVCHHPKGTTILKTGNGFQGPSGLIVITLPKFNKKSPWKVTKGPARETDLVFQSYCWWLKSCTTGDKLPINRCRISSINSIIFQGQTCC